MAVTSCESRWVFGIKRTVAWKFSRFMNLLLPIPNLRATVPLHAQANLIPAKGWAIWHVDYSNFKQLCLLYLSAKDFSLVIVSEIFGGDVLVAQSGWLGKVLVHILCLQAFLSRPAPPNFFCMWHIYHSPSSDIHHTHHIYLCAFSITLCYVVMLIIFKIYTWT